MLGFEWGYRKSDGTPVISDEQIEQFAQDVLRDYGKGDSYIEEPWTLNPLNFLERYCGLYVDFKDIYSGSKDRIAGAMVFNDETIRVYDRENMRTVPLKVSAGTVLIDNSTMEPGKENFAKFTELHEAGHFFLHQEVYKNTDDQQDLPFFMRDTEPHNVVCCRKESLGFGGNGQFGARREWTEEDWREHQANVFASAIAMPTDTFDRIAKEALAKIGCNEGYYLLPTMSDREYDECYDGLAAYLAGKFCVSKTAVKVKLRKRKLVRTLSEDIYVNI